MGAKEEFQIQTDKMWTAPTAQQKAINETKARNKKTLYIVTAIGAIIVINLIVLIISLTIANAGKSNEDTNVTNYTTIIQTTTTPIPTITTTSSKSTTTTPEPIYSGIPNTGNSCFAASALQLLLASNYMAASQQVDDWEAVKDKAPVAYTLHKYNVKHTTGEPLNMNDMSDVFRRVKDKTTNDLFNGGQQDSSELVLWILSRLKEEAKVLKIRLYDELLNIQHEVFIYPNSSQYRISNSSQNQIVLSFTDSIVNEDTVTFARLVEENFKDEDIEADEPITRKTRFSSDKLSSTLIFAINYLTYDKKTYEPIKLRNSVEIPSYVEILNKYYELKSVVVHSGSSGGGHYYAYSRYNGKWWLFNDSQARKTNDVSKVLNDGTRTLLLYEAMDSERAEEIKDSIDMEKSSLAMYELNSDDFSDYSPRKWERFAFRI